MFYFGVRLTYEQAGIEEPTWKDLADLALCWDIDPDMRTQQAARVWQDRVDLYRPDYEGKSPRVRRLLRP